MSKQGFTLVEVLVVTALLAILIGLGVGIFLSNNRFYETQSGEVLAITATREAADRINEFARTAVAFSGYYTYNSVTYTTSSQTVVLQVPALDAAQNILAATYDYVILGANPQDEAQLLLIVAANSASSRKSRFHLITDKLTAINLTYDNADLALARRVDYQITVQETPARYPASEQIVGSATLRNK